MTSQLEPGQATHVLGPLSIHRVDNSGIAFGLFTSATAAVIVLTALAGAAWLTAGIALIPGIIKPDDLTYGPIAAVYTQGWLWIAIWGVLAAVGIIEQLMTTARLERDVVAMYSTRNPM